MIDNVFVISLGGSLVVPEKIDVSFLKNFKNLILKFKNTKFFIIVGGGKTARKYISAASKVSKLHNEDLDWLGIHSTRLNAHLLRTIFRDKAHPFIIKNPTKKIISSKKIFIASGWMPGCSTDFDAVLLAKTFGVKTILNLTNTDFVYDKDPLKFSNAKPLKNVSWKNFRKLIPVRWSPSLNSPFDPVASREAEKLALKVVVMNGKNLKNVENFLKGKPFTGTVIS